MIRLSSDIVDVYRTANDVLDYGDLAQGSMDKFLGVGILWGKKSQEAKLRLLITSLQNVWHLNKWLYVLVLERLPGYCK